MRARIAIGAVVFALASCTSHEASAFSVATAGTDGCHERITEDALRAVRASLPTAKPIAPTDDELAMIEDLPFAVPDDLRDLAGVSLLVGVRDNDLKGRSPGELDQLAMIQANPDEQREHCLRAPSDDEPNGSATALAACKEFIHDRAMQAVAALDAAGVPDPNARVDLDVWLQFRERVALSLPAFWVRIGQALHALEDAFSHTYRTPDGAKVTTVLNFVDYANGTLVESRDGPPHKMALDRCDDADAIRTRNRKLATEAATALLGAALDPALDSAAKSAAIDAVLAKYIDYQPGCTAANDWCNAAENTYPASCTCQAAGAGRAGAFGLAAFLAALLLARKRRRARALAIPAAALALAWPSDARAQCAHCGTHCCPTDPRVAIAANLGGSIADPGFAQSIGLRVRLARNFTLGADAELNEWADINGGRVEPGVASFYAVGILRFPMRPWLELRSTFELGISYELAQLYGVPSGSVGPFGGIYPLGLGWRVSRHVRLTFDPLGLAAPIPHLRGTVFAYPQFRTQVGVEFGL